MEEISAENVFRFYKLFIFFSFFPLIIHTIKNSGIEKKKAFFIGVLYKNNTQTTNTNPH